MKKIRLDYSDINTYQINTTSIRANRGDISKRKAEIKRFLKNYYEVKDSLLKGSFEKILLQLEHRIDVIIVRMGFASTLLESRQLINHHFIKVNNQIITTNSLLLKSSDYVELTSVHCLKPLSHFLFSINFAIPQYLEVNYSTLSGIFIRSPSLDEIPIPFSFSSSFFLK